MPVTQRALAFYPRDMRRAWLQVNDQFEQVREAVEHAKADGWPLSLQERLVLCREYDRLEAVLFGLLPEIEERG